MARDNWLHLKRSWWLDLEDNWLLDVSTKWFRTSNLLMNVWVVKRLRFSFVPSNVHPVRIGRVATYIWHEVLLMVLLCLMVHVRAVLLHLNIVMLIDFAGYFTL